MQTLNTAIDQAKKISKRPGYLDNEIIIYIHPDGEYNLAKNNDGKEVMSISFNGHQFNQSILTA